MSAQRCDRGGAEAADAAGGLATFAGVRSAARGTTPGPREGGFAARSIPPTDRQLRRLLDGIRSASHWAVPGRAAPDALGRGVLLPGRAHRGRPARVGQRRTAQPAPGPDRDGRARRTAPPRRAQPGADPHDRARLLRHHHPGGHPPERAGEPGLVHRLHAVPAGNLPGPAGGAAELPDDDLWPDGAARGRGVAAGRGDRGRGGDDAGAPRGRPGPRVPRRRRLPAADPERAAYPGRTARHRPGRHRRHPGGDRPPAGRCPVRRAAAVPGRVRGRARPGPGHRGGARARRAGRGRRRPARAHPAAAAGGDGRGHRGRHHPAVRPAAELRRPARRLHRRPREAAPAAARPPRRRLRRRRRQARVPARAAGAGTAHPPGEGDQQHLHRAGAARRARRDVRRLPRPRRPGRHRGRCAP